MFWFFPGDVVRQIRDWRDADLACAVYRVANFLFFLFVSTSGLAGIFHMFGKKAEELVCFSAAYQEGVHRYARQQREITERPGTEATRE